MQQSMIKFILGLLFLLVIVWSCDAQSNEVIVPFGVKISPRNTYTIYNGEFGQVETSIFLDYTASEAWGGKVHHQFIVTDPMGRTMTATYENKGGVLYLQLSTGSPSISKFEVLCVQTTVSCTLNGIVKFKRYIEPAPPAPEPTPTPPSPPTPVPDPVRPPSPAPASSASKEPALGLLAVFVAITSFLVFFA